MVLKLCICWSRWDTLMPMNVSFFRTHILSSNKLCEIWLLLFLEKLSIVAWDLAVYRVNARLWFSCASYQGTARLMYNSFGSSLWLLPFSKYCRDDNSYWKHFFDGKDGHHHTPYCDGKEFQSNYSGWPVDIVNIEVPFVRGTEAFPSISEVAQEVTSSMECSLPVQMAFSAREIADGSFFKAIEVYDLDSKRLLHQLHK